jgi:hypothetical protein
MRIFKLNTLLLMTLSQFCDFDLCDTCCDVQFAVEPPPLGRVASPRVLLAIVSPFRSTLVAPIQSPVNVVAPINISSDDSPPPPPKIHPFFIRREVQLSEETHELRFHALARQTAQTNASPHRRAPGRLRLRVSTPVVPPQVAHTASAPRRPPCRMRLPTADSCSPLQYPDLASLAISTPPRVGFPQFQPRLLFPDSPLPSPILVADNSPASRRVMQSCDAGVQTVSPRDFPTHTSVAVQTDPLPGATAPQSPEPLSLQQFQNELQVLRNELRTLVMGFGF